MRDLPYPPSPRPFLPHYPSPAPPRQLNMQMSNCNAVLDLYAASSSGPGAGAPRRRK